jgi:hypothetical protein
MELDDLKMNWTSNNNLLKSCITINFNELAKRNLNKSKRELSSPFIHEIANIVVVTISVIAVLICSITYINELKFSIPGFIAVLIASLYIYLALIKTIRISKIDFENSTIIQIQKEISVLYLLILKFRKHELIMYPFFIVLALPITYRSIQNRDIYSDLSFFIFQVIFIIGIGLVGMFWLNRNIYDKKIRNIQLFIKEIVALEG